MDAIMGHADSSMAAEYRHGIDDSRLRAVVDHVRTWLFGKEGRAMSKSKRPPTVTTIGQLMDALQSGKTNLVSLSAVLLLPTVRTEFVQATLLSAVPFPLSPLIIAL